MLKTNILIVDDDEMTLSRYRRRLENEECEVHVAPSGKEALKKARVEKFDLALLDYLLSDVSGVRLASDLKRINIGIKIMLLSEEPELKYRIY
jgi:DNA-binding response OmpR family regulator